jgi:replicative DNA helicase
MNTKIEKIILQNLLHDEIYLRKTFPFLKSEYFSDYQERIIFDKIKAFVEKYNSLPNQDSLVVSLQNDKTLTEDQYREGVKLIHELDKSEHNENWLLEETEKFCKDKAVYNAILKSISVLDNPNGEMSKDGIPSLLQDALSVCFDHRVGHDYFENSEERYDFYHRQETRIPFDLDFFNKITNGGLPNKTLNVVLAGTGVGKSLFMCHVAASALSQGKNVLYITLEMAEERIAERIDSNLMNVTLDQLKDLPKTIYEKRMGKLREKIEGKLIIKEYPTTGAHVGHFKALLNELQLKKQFHPDIIIIDYLNICASSRLKGGANVNSYMLVKSIAEELRGLAVEKNVPILSATQTTRTGFSNTDVELTDTSESFGLPATVDFMFALISTEDFEKLNQLMVKQLKNRYNDPTINKRFMIGVDRSKMRLYDLENSAQENISDSNIRTEKPRLDNSSFKDLMVKPVKDFSSIRV